MINPIRDAAYIKELGASWLSLQPHVIWYTIEKEPGVYDWSDVDNEVKALQALGLDITMVLSPAINAFGAEREKATKAISQYPSLGVFLREGNAGELQLYPHDETLPLWINFIKAAVARYDGDGKDDFKGLKYAVRSWHFIEEYPIPETKDERIYVDLLKVTYDAIKGEDPESKVILSGLAGNYLRYFAFMDGYIADDEAGVIDSQKHTRLWWNANPFWKNAKKQYEYILEAGKDYYDVMDIHCYIIKESFMEGEIDYIQKTMQRYGYLKPVWIIEGGGPFKNYPGKKAENTPGDPYFGFGSEKENAEFVVKLHAMSAAKGVERQHWGLGLENTDEGYWDGPWKGMSLIDPDQHYKKPSYYTFKIMREMLDGFTGVQDLSQGNLRIFSFTVGDHEVYIIWNTGSDITVDLSDIFGIKDVEITHIVTELDGKRNPVYQQDEIRSTQALPVSLTPIFIDTSE